MKRRFKVLSIFISIVIIVICCNFSYMTKAVENKPDMKIFVATNKYNLKLGEAFEVKYTFEPQPIKFQDINKSQPKDIVLVIDTSGSMKDNIGNGSSKIRAVKSAAKDFVNKFKSEDNVRIAIVDYAMKAYTHPSNSSSSLLMSSKTSNNELLNIIDYGLVADGGTNIGDGIRVAQSILKDSQNKKYVIVMSDGMPTALNYTGTAGKSYYEIERRQWISEKNMQQFIANWWNNDFAKNNEAWTYAWQDEWKRVYYNSYKWNYYDSLEDSTDFKIGTYGNSDPNDYCLNYAKLMASKFSELKISNFMIGFSAGQDLNRLAEIANVGDKKYYDAKSQEAITKLYNDIADQIKMEYKVDTTNLNFQLPEGIEFDGQEVLMENNYGKKSLKLPIISYKLNNSKTQYEAQPFDITLRLKAMKEGNHTLGGNSEWNVSYKGIDNSDIKIQLPSVGVTVNNINLGFELTRRIVDGDTSNLLVGDEYEIEYTIKPKDIKMYYDNRPKEIVLVIDTSGSMKYRLKDNNEAGYNEKSRMEIAKSALNKFLDRFKLSPETKISILSYNDCVNMTKFSNNSNMIDANRTDELKNVIRNLKAGGGTNIGEGIRQGLWLLNQNSNSRKYMVVMSDGEASTYTVPRGNDNLYYEVLDNNNGRVLRNDYEVQEENPPVGDKDTKNFYRYDWAKGFEYSKIMAKKLKGYDAKTFAIGFSKEAGVDKLRSVAQEAGGKFMDATDDDSSAIERVYNDIAEEILSDINVDNIKFADQLPEGVTFVKEGTNGVAKDLSFNYKHKGDGVFSAEPITLKYKIKATKIGEYDLDKATLEYRKNEIEGIKTDYFNNIHINVKGDQRVKQGLFVANQSNVREELKGEKYLVRNDDGSIKNNIDIVNETSTTLAALISSKSTNNDVVITISNPNGVNVSNLNYTLYKVNSKDGTLTQINEKTNIPGTNSSKEINLNINIVKDIKDINANYLVKYNFTSKSNDDNNIKTISTKVIINGQDSNTRLDLNILGKPDLF